MTTSLYPDTANLPDNYDIDDVALTLRDAIDNLQEIARIRETEDISDFANLNQRFVLGRGRFVSRSAPANATDVAATDEEGDIVNDATYEYKLLNISGTLKWDRRTLNTSW